MKISPNDPITDEMLMAYADGTVSELEARAIEMRLAGDPGLEARLEPFLITRDALREAFRFPMHEPVPDRLIDAVLTGANRTSAKQHATWRFGTLFDAVRGWSSAYAYAVPVAAASIVLVVVAALVLRAPAHQSGSVEGALQPQIFKETDGGSIIREAKGSLFAAGVLAAALERGPSGPPHAPEATRGQVVAIPVGTFVANDGRYCREYRVMDRGQRAFAGLACRSTDHASQGEDWQVILHEAMDAAASAANPEKYYTAGRDVPLSLDATVEGMRASDILGGDEEERLISQRWVTE